MPFTTLPPELFSCIVTNIESRPTLCNLARCSRQFYLCTIPHLYHCVDVTIREKSGPREQQNARLQNLASLLIRRPDLAGFVRCLRLYDKLESPVEQYFEYSEEPEESEENVSPKTVEVDPAIKTAVNALSLSKEEENSWLRKLSCPRKWHPDLILALLLPALLKLERLFLVLKAGFHTNYLERTIQRAVCRERPFDIQPAFEALTVFGYCHKMFNERSADFIDSLLKLPAIRAIEGDFGKRRYRNVGEDGDPIEFDSTSSSLISLDLVAHDLSPADLCHILRAPKALKTFSYTSEYINFTDMRHALEPQENHLEYLSFDHDGIYEFFLNQNIDFKFFGAMTSFISFNTLKVFKTAACFLKTIYYRTERHRLTNVFPPSLETLHLTRCQPYFESISEAVEHLLAQDSPQQIPLLKKLILEDKFRPLWKVTHENAIETLSRVAAGRSISVEVI